nr:MAG TPA: hypothetical protein [Caudoviricetes sp.]
MTIYTDTLHLLLDSSERRPSKARNILCTELLCRTDTP